MKIKKANKEDFKIITQLRYEFLKEEKVSDIKYENLEKSSMVALDNNSLYVYLLIKDKSEIGICVVNRFSIPGVHMKLTNECGYITTLYIKKDYRGKGIGRFFLDRIEKIERKSGIDKIILQCSDNVRGFYKKFDYREKTYMGKNFS